ncbi:uncharacterized protein KY384_009004 [Bacidia gigantensis]|uniref:uncharacterized protein n=1 Tax=Bacidia gigantensis TaxID=2732470 RepID=UPI001D040A2E|nr:uncharacterized protein KY384_009004 [Bacidia gigantensis]KAG8525360.1 hypothetical protein KY384_009004 [Bacidia gigantensis]
MKVEITYLDLNVKVALRSEIESYSPTNRPVGSLSSPSLDLPTNGSAGPANPSSHVVCFQRGDPKANEVVPEFCSLAIDDIAKRDGFDEFSKTQTWFFGPPRQPRGVHVTPDRWVAGDGSGGLCQVAVANSGGPHYDQFRLVDIAAKAKQIFDTCVIQQKDTLGGSSSIGTGKGFFVVLTGKTWTPSGQLADVTLVDAAESAINETNIE